MEHAELWLKFTAAALIVVGAGMSLTKNAENLADAMGWGHAFAGFVILGWATSLPEVTISVSAVTEVGSADLSTGNITGSVIFNLAILALLELLSRRALRRSPGAARGVLALGGFNLVLLIALALAMHRPGWVSGRGSAAIGLILVGGYLATTLHAWLTRDQGEDEPAEEAPEPSDRPGAGGLMLRCALAGAAILGAGIWLTHLGDRLAQTYDLEQGLVGSLFLACVSSLPELVTGLQAMRLGLLIMAAASILGSNIFNLGILGACDLIYLRVVDGSQAMVAAAQGQGLWWNVLAALGMTGLAILAVRSRARDGTRGLRVVSALVMLGLYLAALTSHH